MILSIVRTRDGNTQWDPKPENFQKCIDTTGWFGDKVNR